jgi:hypothetical protein
MVLLPDRLFFEVITILIGLSIHSIQSLVYPFLTAQLRFYFHFIKIFPEKIADKPEARVFCDISEVQLFTGNVSAETTPLYKEAKHGWENTHCG